MPLVLEIVFLGDNASLLRNVLGLKNGQRVKVKIEIDGDDSKYFDEVMSVQSSVKEMKLKLTLRDPRAIEIVEGIPIKQRDEIIEKYIILGEMLVSHASISTRKETVEEFFAPLKSDIEMIREQLRLIVPTIAVPAKKGEITVETIFQSLQEHFIDDSFEDVSRIGKYTDILATTSDTKTPILIELKDYKGIVPSEEVDKFWRDIERRGTRYGIFVSMRQRELCMRWRILN